MKPLVATKRTRVRRAPDRALQDRSRLHEIIDEAFLAHIGFADDIPMVIPVLCWRVDENIYVHGSVGSRMIKCLANGQESCTTFTLLDGLVFARSAFYHSANYRSAVVIGTYEVVSDKAEKTAALKSFMDQLVKGRWQELRPMTEKELKATAVLRLPLTEASVKVRTGGPGDPEADQEHPVWAGVYPIEYSVKTAVSYSDQEVAGSVPELIHPAFRI